mgnify:CR=1 FL=1
MTAVVTAVMAVVAAVATVGPEVYRGGCRPPEPGEMLLWMQGNCMSCMLALFCTYLSYPPIHSNHAGRAQKRVVRQARIEPLGRPNAPRPSMSTLRPNTLSRSEPDRLRMTLGELKRCKMHENEGSGL